MIVSLNALMVVKLILSYETETSAVSPIASAHLPFVHLDPVAKLRSLKTMA